MSNIYTELLPVLTDHLPHQFSRSERLAKDQLGSDLDELRGKLDKMGDQLVDRLNDEPDILAQLASDEMSSKLDKQFVDDELRGLVDIIDTIAYYVFSSLKLFREIFAFKNKEKFSTKTLLDKNAILASTYEAIEDQYVAGHQLHITDPDKVENYRLVAKTLIENVLEKLQDLFEDFIRKGKATTNQIENLGNRLVNMFMKRKQGDGHYLSKVDYMDLVEHFS